MMSDFTKTMKDWKRMCDKMDKDYGTDACCTHCPLSLEGVVIDGCDAIYTHWAANADWDKVASIIEEWAAENPEPVYPTWAEWLIEHGLTEYQGNVFNDYRKDGPFVTKIDAVLSKAAYKPIPADIAEKLGLKPKGGNEND